MRDYIILNNKNSNEIKGLLIQNLPPITKPRIRAEIEEIDGRDGDIVTPLGYGAYDKVFSIGLYGDFDINEVIKYFDSEGIVVFSNEPNKYYNYKILEQIDFEKLIRFRTADIMMHVQPFKYSTTEGKETEEMETKTASGSEIDLPDTNNEKLQMEKLKGDTYQDQHESPNLLQIDAPATQEFYGITITNNGDGTITLNGTATNPLELYLPNLDMTTHLLEIKKDTDYFLNGCMAGGSLNTYNFIIEGENWYADTGNGVQFNSHSDDAVHAYLSIASGVTFDNAIFKPMLVEGTEAQEFEPYGKVTPSPQYPSEVKVVTGENVVSVSGKNLFNILEIPTQTKNGVTFTNNGNGTFNLTGTATTATEFSFVMPLSETKLVGGKQYTMSTNREGLRAYVHSCTSSGTWKTTLGFVAGGTSRTFNLAEPTTNYIKFSISILSGASVNYENAEIQLEEGSTASEYTPYSKTDYTINLGNIELCKIGDYKDYLFKRNGKWYVHKEIGKQVVDGSETYSISNAKENSTYFQVNGKTFISISASEEPPAFNTHFPRRNGSSLYSYDNVGFTFSLSGYLRINVLNTLASTIEDFKTWLSNNNVTIYYALATPTEEEITDETLIAQLEVLDNIYNQKGSTKIKTNPEANNMPLDLDVSYTESRPITITNSGNIYSKPIFTIYGEGNIGVYLNDIQLFDINLGSEEQITIDVAEMQAYNKETKVLKNRLVTGNYDKFLLKIGENKISFSGIVKKFEIENYSRWI